VQFNPDQETPWSAESAFREVRRVKRGTRFDVFRAVRQSDGRRVVLKAVRRDRPSAESAALLRHSSELLRRLDGGGVERLLGLDTVDGDPFLIVEDAGAEGLGHRLAGHPMTIDGFLDLAVAIAQIVAAVHAHNIIHRDICPANLVCDGDQVTLVDLAKATSVSGFAQTAGVPGELHGTLAYMAPEQTGRVKHLVDHRADLYAVGCVFYEMLTGAPPFVSADPLELIHFHIARPPVPPAIINPAVPELLSRLVLKLLAKTPAARYQTAEALVTDLEEARR
jgi:serine/threonine protein kinase